MHFHFRNSATISCSACNSNRLWHMLRSAYIQSDLLYIITQSFPSLSSLTASGGFLLPLLLPLPSPPLPAGVFVGASTTGAAVVAVAGGREEAAGTVAGFGEGAAAS